VPPAQLAERHCHTARSAAAHRAAVAADRGALNRAVWKRAAFVAVGLDSLDLSKMENGNRKFHVKRENKNNNKDM
jgi:hypothetical protein